MNHQKGTHRTLIRWSVFILVDIALLLILGVLQMDYDDHYDVSKGEYGSLGSMNLQQKVYYGLFVFWIVLNVTGLAYLGIHYFRKKNFRTR